MSGPRANRLAETASPYLLQHAENPVDWYPWGEAALARALSEDKPILLSIGYSACHWCHVMAHESFEDEAIAALMNQHFVCVKVDREERPDLDQIYMAATTAMNHGQGGWPMTVFLTAEQEPFFAGTYFPPRERWGRPGFATLLERLAHLWKTDRASLRAQAARVVEHLRETARAAPGSEVGESELRTAAAQLAADFDPRWGGFGGAPKFPPATALGLLLRCHRRFSDPQALEVVRTTLHGMARGGLCDQIGGGFCRYSVDERWLVPHFEKMLYDNALLARAYLEGYQATGEAAFRRVAAQTLDYLLREMTSPEGGFYSSTDADSEGEEGKFFVWTPAQVEQVLDPEQARRFCAYYDITECGNWEGKSIPNTPEPLETVASRLGVEPRELWSSLETARTRMYQARGGRVPPGLDDKILTAWNGLAIGALAEGHRVLGDRRYLEAAVRCAQFVLRALRTDGGRLLRTYRAGRAHLDAYLEDYAYLAGGLLDLYEAGGAPFFLEAATALAERLRSGFAAAEGGFYSTAEGHETLIVRHREGHDGATPNPNAAAAEVLARLSFHLGRAALREEAERALRAYGKHLSRQPRAFAKALCVVDFLIEGPVELALLGAPGGSGVEALRGELARHFLPNRVIAHHDPASGEPDSPLLVGKGLVDDAAALYVCRDQLCRPPITDPSQVAAALAPGPPGTAPARALPAGRRSGHATGEGTHAYARRHIDAGLAHGYGPLGSTGLTSSRIGFGGYRIDDETPAHREALAHALGSGCNLVDTSSNYTDGGSERLIGEVLGEMAASGEIAREQIVVVSKVGYVQGRNLELARERERSGSPFPEMVKYAEGIWHCLHPEFLKDQIERSRGRLGLGTIDVMLLHNPEYFLSDAERRGEGDLTERRQEFHRRLREAFACLEAEVEVGRIRCYGVSSNTCTAPAGEPEATSLSDMLEAAREAGGEHHRFRVLQFPLNLLEGGGVVEPNQGPGRSVLQCASDRRIAVLVNRPLNAMDGQDLLRLADLPEAEPAATLDEGLRTVSRLEDEFRREIAPRAGVAGPGSEVEDPFQWGHLLGQLAPQLRGLPHWEHLEDAVIAPRLGMALRSLDSRIPEGSGEEWHGWRGRYLAALGALLQDLRAEATRRSRSRFAPITTLLDPLMPAERRREGLARKALWTLASTPGVSAVLVGMRRRQYVDDALGVLRWAPLPKAWLVFEKVRGLAAGG